VEIAPLDTGGDWRHAGLVEHGSSVKFKSTGSSQESEKIGKGYLLNMVC
jgi:hypothetical protein